jgi:2-haloacid dehalogenase
MSKRTGSIDAVVLDVGNVLIHWDPPALYRKIFLNPDGTPDEDKVAWFLANICAPEWNIQQDLGRSIAEGNAALIRRHPELRDAIEAYYGHHLEALTAPIQSTVDCMRALQNAGVPVHGLTNYGRETFAMAKTKFDFLNEFDGVVVSGEEGLIKPDPAIFQVLIVRFKLTPGRTLFVDDSAANIAAASRLGFHVHHFTDPVALKPCLIWHGLLGSK